MTDTAENTATRGRALTIALWVVQGLLALGFAFGGYLKVVGDPVMVDLFDDIGAGQWLRFVVGVLEIAGGVGVLVPRLYGLAALGLAALMAGAAVTNVVVLGLGPWVPLLYLVMAALVAWGRWPQTVALAALLRR